MEKAGQRLPISAGRILFERASDSRPEINRGKGTTNSFSRANILQIKKVISARPDISNTCFQQLL
jgi:hypothetical protein